MVTKKQRTEAEWVGGIFSMPAYVTDEGKPYRPETLIWLSPKGAVLGHASAKPGELLALACDNLLQTMERPLVGPPRKPTRLRVASKELAETLRASGLGFDIVCGPTPEVDAVIAAMKDHLHEADSDETPQTYLLPGVSPMPLPRSSAPQHHSSARNPGRRFRTTRHSFPSVSPSWA